MGASDIYSRVVFPLVSITATYEALQPHLDSAPWWSGTIAFYFSYFTILPVFSSSATIPLTCDIGLLPDNTYAYAGWLVVFNNWYWAGDSREFFYPLYFLGIH